MILLVVGFMSCKSNSQDVKTPSTELSVATAEDQQVEKPTSFTNSKGEKIDKVYKSPEEWKKQLTKMEFYVIREKGTERSFTGDLLKKRSVMNKGILIMTAILALSFATPFTHLNKPSNMKMIYVPEGFAHGFAVLSKEAIVHYKTTALYQPELETIKELVKDKMENAVKLAVPLDVEMNAAENWLLAH